MFEESDTATFDDLIRAGILEVGDGYRAKLDELGGAGPVFLRAALLAMRASDFEAAERFHGHLAAKVANKLGRPGDTVVTTKGNSVGRTSYVPQDAPPFVYSPHLSYWRSVDARRLSRGYLRYWSKSREFTSQLEALAHGTDMAPYLSLVDQRRLRITLPAIGEQKGIADVLGALDDKIAANGRIVGHTYGLMRCHYESAITDDTAATTIGSIADVFDGPHATPKKTDSGPWFLSISSLKRGRLVLEESAHLSEQDFDQWTRRVMPRLGDVLFSYETRLGEAALMPAGVRACLGRRMGLLRSRKGQVGPRTLLQAFLGESFQDTIRQRAVHGATVDRIPLTELPSWPISLPARDAERLEHVLGGLDELASYKDRENEVLAALRDALLPRLMSGEIRVRDAEKAVEDAT